MAPTHALNPWLNAKVQFSPGARLVSELLTTNNSILTGANVAWISAERQFLVIFGELCDSRKAKLTKQ